MILDSLFSRKKTEPADEKPELQLPVEKVVPEKREEPALSQELIQRISRIEKIRSSLDEFANTITEAKTSSTLTENRLSSIRELVSNAQQDINHTAKLERINSELSIELDTARSSLNIAVSDLDDEKSRVDALKIRLTETREALQQAHVALSQNVKNIESLNGQVDELRSRLNEQEYELSSFKDVNSLLEAENAEHRTAIQSNNSIMAEKLHLLSEYETRLEEMKRVQEQEHIRREKLTSDIEDLRSRLNETSRDKIDLETRYEIAVSDLTSRSKHFKERTKAKDDRIYALESKIEALEGQTRVSFQTIDELKEENRELLKILAKEDERQRSLKSQIEELKSSHNTDREKLFASVSKISELELRISSLIDDKDQAVNENVAFSQMVDRLTNENKQLSEKLIVLSSIEEKYNKLLLKHERANTKLAEEEENVVALKSSKKKSA